MPDHTGFARKRLIRDPAAPRPKIRRSPFVELGVTSPFSFLRGASDAIELVLSAVELGMDSLGIADRNTLAGVVRMHSACSGAGLKPLTGCRLDLTEQENLNSYDGLTVRGTAAVALGDVAGHIYFDTLDLAPNGVMGDVSNFDADAGGKLLAHIVDNGVEFVNLFKQHDTRIQ